MILTDVQPLIQQIKQVNFCSVSPVKAQAIGGILHALNGFSAESSELFNALYRVAEERFCNADSHEAQVLWLSALQHMTAYGELFTDVFDDVEYKMLVKQQHAIQQRQLDDVKDLIDGVTPLWRELSLKESLQRLDFFYHQDIHQFSQGDDRKAYAILDAAAVCFERCRESLFLHHDADMETLFLYYHVLCLCHPGYRHPGNVPYYKQYFRTFQDRVDALDRESDLGWQAREVAWHHRLQHEHHYDLSILSGLSLADSDASSAFRLQCYRWLLDLDPEDDDSIQAMHDRHHFVDAGIHRLTTWLDYKWTARIPIPQEQEAETLLTLLCAMKLTFTDFAQRHQIIDRAYDLLSLLPDDKLKAHLLVHLHQETEDEDLLPDIDHLLDTWDDDTMTEEDRYLQELCSTIDIMA